MNIISIKTKQMICAFLLSLCFLSVANGQFKKVEDLDLSCVVLEVFQKENNYYLAGVSGPSLAIYKWTGNRFEYYQYIMFTEDVYYMSCEIFYQNNEPYFILSDPMGTDIYVWNESEELFTKIQNIPLILPYGSNLKYFSMDNTPWIAMPASDDKIWVYEWDGTQFDNKTNFPCPGADPTPIYVNNTLYLITTFYDSPAKIYKWNGIRFMMSNDFQVPSVNELLATSFTYNSEQLFLFFTSMWTSEQGDTFEIDRWNGESLEQVYEGTTKSWWFFSFSADNRQFISLNNNPDEEYIESIYEWKDNQLVLYQTIQDETNSDYFLKYFTIDEKNYMLMSRYFSNMTLYEWESSEQKKKTSLSDVIAIMKYLSEFRRVGAKKSIDELRPKK
ncbi:leucine-rich glioma-inactivated protein 1 isoform X2 [Candidatus Magnetomorum sp. HK-1]|nr:leucine-rich glioma-inactivated protein 1 isoform X2 [Candidatus Magnetomorum sp. HK-1]